MTLHHFHLKGEWQGGRNSEGYIDAGELQTKISIPPEMDGPGVGTNPDEMLLGAAATCYIISLAAMLERAEIPVDTMSITSEGMVDVTNGIFTYKKIIHRPNITLKKEVTEQQTRLTNKLIEKAEKTCMISRAIKGNVQLELEPTVQIKE
ncbi:OsmC family protein [Oceanobacillus jeddahense]|uniref:OsmC family protein n=1 Tax=Oceanobacillus jeddahense TaxID=1462527 RepID=A0ABY5JTA3_9BACI|nr:OsmC family protein [Oceanobacillus jeddahense]UUI02682.1 OsmC family protein [Oceanobacillus jeddahense]